jgi:hypothetical protein
VVPVVTSSSSTNMATANANPLFKVLIEAVRQWIRICTRHASRSFSFCYVLWRALLQRLTLTRPRRNHDHFPRTITGRDNVSASSIPPPLLLTDLGDNRNGAPSQDSAQETSATPSQPSILRSSLRSSSTSTETPRKHVRTPTVLSHEQILESPTQERRPTVTFGDQNGGYEVASPLEYGRSESPRSVTSDGGRWKLEPFYPDSSERYDRLIEV